MKFCKRYREYNMSIQGRGKELPGLGLKRLKKILKRCRRRETMSVRSSHDGLLRQRQPRDEDGDDMGGGEAQESRRAAVSADGCSSDHCPGFWGCCIWFKGKLPFGHHGTLVQEGNDLVTYAFINSIAMRKILKKYDKIHYSKQGQAFRSQAQSMHIEILQSPWLRELMAFYINLREDKFNTRTIPGPFEDCFLTFDGGKPTLSCGMFDSLKLEINLNCSICLDTVFDPVSLTCGHIFCYMCCCSAASVTVVDGLKSADPKARCPLCREAGVYGAALHLDELSILLSQSCPEYWEQRLQSERIERIRQVKEYWDSECRAFMGI